MKHACLGLVLGAALAASTPALAQASGPVTVVTHFDFLPNNLDQALPALQAFVQDSRTDPGVTSFTLITWAPTNNHFQVIETYRNLDAYNSHVQQAHTIGFRNTIAPLIGSPIDERLYLQAP